MSAPDASADRAPRAASTAPPSRLDAAVRQQPELRDAATALRALLGALRAVDAALPAHVPNADAARARLHAGIPALAGEPLLDGASLRASLGIVAERLREAGADDAAEAFARVGQALGGLGATDADALAQAALAGAWDDVLPLASRLDVDDYAIVTVFDYAARPALRAGAGHLAEVLREAHWARGHCPACGAPPILAELRGKESERVLRCGRCGTGWPFPRLGCPACGERDHRQLGALHAEGEGEFRRADCCEQCRSYVKSVAVLDALTPEAVVEEDLATATLDLVAVERGYHR